MNQSVSARSIFSIASILSMAILWVVFVLPAMGAVAGGLLGLFTLGAAIRLSQRAHHDEREPARVTVRARPVQ